MNEKEKAILEDLNSSKSAKRRSAAKRIGKKNLIGLTEDLFSAYQTEKLDSRTWETQKEMILSLGLLDCKKVEEDLLGIINLNKEHDMITSVAAASYVRIKRNSLSDGTIILSLIERGNYSVISGTFTALAQDKMTPPNDDIARIIDYSKDLNIRKDYVGSEFGLMDPRIGLAIACHNWPKELTHEFLNYCIENCSYTDRFGSNTKNKYLIDACEHSLKGKYVNNYL